MRRSGAVLGMVAAVAAVVLAGCGNVAEKVTERAIEEAIESEAGGNADVDIDEDGSFRMKSSDGSFEVSADGNLTDGFPSDVPMVDGAVQASWSSSDGSSEAWWATLEVDDAEAAYAEARSMLEGAGYTVTGTYEGTSGGQYAGNLTAEGDWMVSVSAVQGEPSTISYALTTPTG